MKNFIVSKINNQYVAVPGYEAGNGLFIYNSHGKHMLWCVSDILSGALVDGHFNNLQDAKNFVATLSDELKNKINLHRNTKTYKDKCAAVKVEADKLLSKKDIENNYNVDTFESTFEALDELNTEIEVDNQLNLFELK